MKKVGKFIVFLLVVLTTLVGCSKPDSVISMDIKLKDLNTNDRGSSQVDYINVSLLESERDALCLSEKSAIFISIKDLSDISSLLDEISGDESVSGIDTNIISNKDYSLIDSGIDKIERSLKPINIGNPYIIHTKIQDFYTDNDIVSQLEFPKAKILIIIVNPDDDEEIIYYDLDGDGIADYVIHRKKSTGKIIKEGSANDPYMSQYVNTVIAKWLGYLNTESERLSYSVSSSDGNIPIEYLSPFIPRKAVSSSDGNIPIEYLSPFIPRKAVRR